MSDTREALAKRDNEWLLGQPQFRRWFLRAIQTAALFARTTDGSEGRHLAYHEGRRNLALELLAEVAEAQPIADPEGLFTLFQLLREEAQQQPEDSKRDRKRYDRTAELTGAEDDPE